MSKRHNRKRTRSRPRNRDKPPTTHSQSQTYSQPQNHIRTSSTSTTSSTSSTPTPVPLPFRLPPYQNANAHHWQQQYSAWQSRLAYERARVSEMEKQRVRFFGGEVGEDEALVGPMLRVVLELFDGDLDFVDPV